MRVVLGDKKTRTTGTNPFQPDVVSYSGYFPFGMQMQEDTWQSPLYRYGYNGKEKDGELKGEGNSYDYGARMLDNRVARFTTTDPLEQLAPNLTPYRTFNNNPIRYNDPDGRWEADSKGNLIAEDKDNIQTLAKHQSISEEAAKKMAADQGYEQDKDGNISFIKGQILKITNQYTIACRNTNGTYDTDCLLVKDCDKEFQITRPEGYPALDPNDAYNCYGAAIKGSQGKEIKPGISIDRNQNFDNLIMHFFTPVNGDNLIFGTTVIRIATPDGIVRHGAVFYGKNNDGEIYVFTKNGPQLIPEVMKLKDLITKTALIYGNVKGRKDGESGFYNPNPEFRAK